MSNLLPNLWYLKHGPLINQQQRPPLLGHSPDLLNLNWCAKSPSFLPPNPAMVSGGLSLTCSHSSQEKQWGQASWSIVGSSVWWGGSHSRCHWGVKETREMAEGTGIRRASLVIPIRIMKCTWWLDFRSKTEKEWSLSSESDRWKKNCAGHKESGVGTERNTRKWLALSTSDLRNGSSSIAPVSPTGKEASNSIWLAYCSAVFSRSIDQINITWKNIGDMKISHSAWFSKFHSSIKSDYQKGTYPEGQKETAWKHQVRCLYNCLQKTATSFLKAYLRKKMIYDINF